MRVDEGQDNGAQYAIEAHGHAGKGAGFLVDAERAGDAQPVRADANGGAAHPPWFDAAGIEDIWRQYRSQHAGDDSEHSGEGGGDVDTLGNAHGDRCGHGFGVHAADDVFARAHVFGDEHGAGDGGRAADAECERDGDDFAAQFLKTAVDRHRKCHGGSA